jgi:hypothetical protein
MKEARAERYERRDVRRRSLSELLNPHTALYPPPGTFSAWPAFRRVCASLATREGEAREGDAAAAPCMGSTPVLALNA